MTDLLNRLFQLEGMGFGSPGAEFGFARPFPAWGWALAVLAGAGIAWWSYWRLTGRRAVRIALAGLRGGLLLALLVLIAGPELRRANERIEGDWVLFLLDRSASMTIPDAPGVGDGRRTREAQMRAALEAHWPALAALAGERTVVWMGFDAGAFDLRTPGRADGDPPADAPLDPGSPTGRRTSLGAALSQALARSAARPVSGVVILSDGRSVDEPDRAALRRLQAERIPVHTFPLGSPEPVADLAVREAEAPVLAFVDDTIPVRVDVERLGAGDGSGGTVQLIDKATGLVLVEERLPAEGEWRDGAARVLLRTRSAQPGKGTWVARLVPDRPDLIADNNQAEVAVEFVDRPLRVAYFDGYPRWEYRYLKNLLVREASIESVAMLLAPNRRYLQEGDVLLESLPRSPEDWARFDVVVVGDLSPRVFSDEQLEQLKEHVATRGAGLLWIGGPGSTPRSWIDTPLAALLPFTVPSGGAGEEGGIGTWDEPVTMSRAPAADRLGLLELGDPPDTSWPDRLTDPFTGWSRLRWSQRIEPDRLKPTAEVLAVAEPESGLGAGEGPYPLVLSMRYGAGRVLYVATDEIWRWRYARGEDLEERFWLPLLRLQGRDSLARNAQAAILTATPRRAEVDKPVRIALELVDQTVLDAAPRSLRVRAARREAQAGAAPTELTLVPEPGADRRELASTWVPVEAGLYRLEVLDAAPWAQGLAAEVEVVLPGDELRTPETDHALLARLSEATGGRVLGLDRLGDLNSADLLPQRRVVIAGTPDVRTLWDRPIVLALILALLALEWVGRRLIRLA